MAKKFFGNVELKADLKLSNFTTERALIIDASGNLVVSAVTNTELGYISGLTSAVQTQLDDKIASSEKGAANGVASLDGSGKLPSAQLPVSATEYKGAWNANTNIPALADGSGVNGDLYRVSVSGSQDLGSGSISLVAGDAIIYNGSIWEKIPGEDIIQSVNGATGIVVLDSDDISEGAANFYYTEGRFDTSFSGKDSSDLNFTQATPGNWTLADDSSIKLTLDEVGSRLVAVEGGSTDNKDLKISANDSTAGFLEDKIVVSSGSNSVNILEISTLNDAGDEDLQIQIDEAKIDHDALLNFVANEHIDWTADAGASNINDANIVSSSITQHQGDLSITASQVSDFDTEVGNNTDVAANTAARHDAITLNAGQVTQDSANLVGQEIELVEATSSTAGVMSSSDKTKLDGLSGGSAGDIAETAFAGAESAASASITGFAFANASVRSFRALVHAEIDATADLFEVFYIEGIQKGASWEISVSSTGDDTAITFDISAAGQLQYSSSTYAGFVSMDITFRAISTSK